MGEYSRPEWRAGLTAQALTVPLEDPAPPNARVIVETTTGASDPSGMYEWTVAGVGHVVRQWFWFRIMGPSELNLSTLPDTVIRIDDTNTTPNFLDDEVEVEYSDPAGMVVNIVLRLRGGALGTFESTVTETVTVTNVLPFSLDVHFYQYTNLDLAGSANNDGVQISGASNEIATHVDPNVTVTQTRNVPGPLRGRPNRHVQRPPGQAR